MATTHGESINDRGGAGVAVAHEVARPRAELTTGELVDHLEWSYNGGLPFDADIVWELARRALAGESKLTPRDQAGSSQ